MPQKTMIIGSGVAAFEAAVTLRQADPQAEIHLFTREHVLPYRRPALPKLLTGDLPDAQFFLKPPEFFREQRLEWHPGSELLRLDVATRTLIFADGTARSCDQLLLAVGGGAFRPAIPGVDNPIVMALREYADALAIREKIRSGVRRITVLGGGLLGLELADALLQTGAEVTVVEGCSALLPRQLAAADSTRALAHLQTIPRLRVELGRFPAEIRDQGVELADGSWIPADLILLSVGMRANSAIAVAAGLAACPGGIRVDRELRTSVPWIFAAGDCAALDGQPGCGLYLPCRDMGRIAGANLAGGHAFFTHTAVPARMTALGLKLVGECLSCTAEPGKCGN